MSIEGMGARIADGRITSTEAQELVRDAGGPSDAHALQRLTEDLAPFANSQSEAAIIAQQVLDVARSTAPDEVLLIEFPMIPSALATSQAPRVAADHGDHLGGSRADRLRQAIASGDVALMRGVYQSAPPAERAALADTLLQDGADAVRQAGTRLLATDGELSRVLVSANPDQQRRLLNAAVGAADAALTRTSPANALSRGEALAARESLGTFVISNLAGYDRLRAAMPASERQALARVVMPAYVASAPPNFDNYTRLVRMAEDLSPGASQRDVARVLRRQYYGDNMLQFAGLSAGDYTPRHTADLERTLESLPGAGLKRRWQEIPGPDGRRMDIGHSLVALDAYNNSAAGRLSAWTFTDFGDAGSEVVSWLGENGAGNYNEPDARGNDFGEVLYTQSDTVAAQPLSERLRHAAGR